MFPQVFGKFVLEGELSSGGMARVFLATLRGAVGFEKRLVVKQIRPELASDERFVERFVTEAKTSVELTHPNIVPVYELGVEAGVYYIAMELCPGVTLAELLAQEGALPPEEGAYIGVELARALGYAHRRAGIVHRDVTPRNVLIDDEGAVRLIDFGIAEPVTAASDAGHEVFGTPGHMPPEQILGQKLTPATDVFALAALLYECFAGVPAFRRASEDESLRAVSSPPAPLDDERLEPLRPVLDACFAELPEDRPGDMDELGRALRDFLRGTDLGDVAGSLGRRVRRVRRTSQADIRRERLLAEGDERRTRPLEAPSTAPLVASQASRTFATRRLEVGPVEKTNAEETFESKRVASPAPVAANAARRGQRTRLVGALAIGVALAAAWWLIIARERPVVPAPKHAASAALQSSQVTPAAPKEVREPGAPSADAVAVPAPTQAGRAPVEPQPAPSFAARGEPSASAPAAQKRGVVSFSAAPGAEVSVAGRTLKTPVPRLELPVGSYRVTFQSPTWDGGLSVTVEISEDAPRSVHADFTTEPPRVVSR